MGFQQISPVDRPVDWDPDRVGLLELGGLLGARPERSRQQWSLLEEGLLGLGGLGWLLLAPPPPKGQPVVAA